MSFCSRVGAGRRQRRSKSRRVWRSAPRREGEASATKAGTSHSGQTSDPSDFSTTEKARDEARSTPSERRARWRRARKSSDAARDSQKEKPGRRFESGASSASGGRTRAARRPDSPSAASMRRGTSGAQETSAGQKSAAENCPASDAGEKLAAANADGACPWPSSAATVCMGRGGWFSPRYSRAASSQTRLRTSSRKCPGQRASAAITADCSARSSGASSGMTSEKASGRSHRSSSASAQGRMASRRRASGRTCAGVRGAAERTQSRDMARLLFV